MFDIKDNLRNLPDRPGVYLHKDDSGNIIYVGKAISLKNRVRQYFMGTSRMEPKVKAMVSHIAEFEYILTDTEMEALLLEAQLVKKYMPQYNVLLRDDKSFPYIKVTLGEYWPRVLKTRRVLEDGGRYFGPYTDVSALHQIVDLLSDSYGMKRCAAQGFPEDWKPCLNCHIGKCKGYCAVPADHEEYMEGIRQILEFLSGDTKEVLFHLEQKMKEEATSLNFEKAAVYRDQIAAISAIPNQEKLDAFLTQVGRNRVKVVRRNAERIAQKQREQREQLDISFQNVFGMSAGSRTEAYDISHIAGTDAVGAMVVFEDAKPLRKAYRRFRIRTAPGGGDTDSLQEVLYRRIKRGLAGDPSFLPLPELLLIDGGKNQVNAVGQVLLALGVDIPIAGMVKDEKHRTRGIVYRGEEKELKSEPLLYRYISGIQDEVHRFAIEYHRGQRAKKLQKSELDEIPGIGEKRKQILFKTFGSIEAIATAEMEALRSLPGMNQAAAEAVKKHLNNYVVKKEI
ncbi:MAG: excinuclease ABC subunit UvrC [Eubacteriales bacterium]|nr:excinuclease ABC subunit UvrC [Eubacteriales bacterium]